MSHYCSAIVLGSVMRSEKDGVTVCHELRPPMDQQIPFKNRSKPYIRLTKGVRLNGQKADIALVQKTLNQVSDHHEIDWLLWSWQKVCNGQLLFCS